MPRLADELAAWLPGARTRAGAARLVPRLEEIGRVETLGDGVATVSGLPHTRLGELLRLADGTPALAVGLDPDRIGCVLLGSGDVTAGTRVDATGEVARVPVGDGLLGRIVDPLGRPLDGKGPIVTQTLAPIERPAPSIIDRDLVTQPVQTGLVVIDTLFALGRGQRELIVGDRATVTNSSDDALAEISAPGVTKATGLAVALERHGVGFGDVLVFGDMPNDLPMITAVLEAGGRAVAVANAHPAVRAAAPELTSGHDVDGVARYLEKVLGIGADGV